MANHDSHEPEGQSAEDLAASVAAGYEIEDVSLSVLLRWGVGLAIFLIATSAFGMILFAALQRPPFGPPELDKNAMRSAKVVPAAGTPIVQDNPAGDPRPDNNRQKGIDNIREFRREEEIRMSEYAMQDGAIHIPLETALKLGVKDFEAQKPGETPTGVTPTPEMKIHAAPVEPGPPGAPGTAPTGTETVPGGGTGTAPAGASGTTPGIAPGSAPTGASGTLPGSTPGSAPTGTTGMAPGKTPSGAPGAAPGSETVPPPRP